MKIQWMRKGSKAPDGFVRCTSGRCEVNPPAEDLEHCHEQRVGDLVRMGCGVRVDLSSELHVECAAFMLCIDFPPERIVRMRDAAALQGERRAVILLNVACAMLSDGLDGPPMVLE